MILITTDKTWGGDVDLYMFFIFFNVTFCARRIAVYQQEAGPRTKKNPDPQPKYVFGHYKFT
jgi:hypothetical protein